MCDTPPPSTANAAGTDAFANADSAKAAAVDEDNNDAGAAASSNVDAADDNGFDDANDGMFDNKAAVNVADNNPVGDDAVSNAAVGNAECR